MPVALGCALARGLDKQHNNNVLRDPARMLQFVANRNPENGEALKSLPIFIDIRDER